MDRKPKRTNTERQQDYRDRHQPDALKARVMAERVYRLLCDHPVKVGKFDRLIVQVCQELKDAIRHKVVAPITS